MHAGPRTLAGFCLIAALVLTVAPDAAAMTFAVDTNPFTASGMLGPFDLWNTYELTAANGDRVAYTVTASGSGCVMVLFVKGHSVTLSSTYYTSYSQENCVSSYSDTFPVGSDDGTSFTVLVTTSQTTDVAYTVRINVQAPTAIDLALMVVVVVLVVGAPVIAAVVLWRRRKAKTPPPVQAPQPYPPGYPPQQPPPPAQPLLPQPPTQPGTPP